MECPFKLPAKYEMKITNTEYIVVDAERKVIAKCNYEDDALYIQQVLNIHSNLVDYRTYVHARIADGKPIMRYSKWFDTIEDLEQALKEAEKE